MASLLSKFQNALCIAGMAALIVLVLLQISGRLLPWSFPWTEEVARYVFVWTVLLGMAVAVRNKEMIALELFGQSTGPRLKRGLSLVASAMALVFFGAIAVLGAMQAMTQYQGGNVAYSLPLPLWMVGASIPVSFGLAAIWSALSLVEQLKSGEDREP